MGRKDGNANLKYCEPSELRNIGIFVNNISIPLTCFLFRLPCPKDIFVIIIYNEISWSKKAECNVHRIHTRKHNDLRDDKLDLIKINSKEGNDVSNNTTASYVKGRVIFSEDLRKTKKFKKIIRRKNITLK